MTKIKVNIIKFDFYGSSFEAFYVGGGLFLVPISNMVEALGMDYSSQMKRIQRHPVLNNGVHTLKLERPYGDAGATRMREVVCLDLRKVPFFMGGLDVGHVSDPDKYQRIVSFQERFAEVAWAAFRTDIVNDPDVLAELDMFEPPEMRKYNSAMDEAATMRRLIDDVDNTMGGLKALAEEIQSMHKNQLTLEELAEEIVNRLLIIKAQIIVSAPLSGKQALTIRKMAQVLADNMAQHDLSSCRTSRRYWVRRVLTQLNDHFSITSFMFLNQVYFVAAIRFLRDIWFENVGEDLPEEFMGWQPSMLE